MADSEHLVFDFTYTFDGVTYRSGEPMPREVAEEHGIAEKGDPVDARKASDTDGGFPLPESFPYYEALSEHGYETVEDVSEATDEQLQQVRGIGSTTIETVRETAQEILSA